MKTATLSPRPSFRALLLSVLSLGFLAPAAHSQSLLINDISEVWTFMKAPHGGALALSGAVIEPSRGQSLVFSYNITERDVPEINSGHSAAMSFPKGLSVGAYNAISVWIKPDGTGRDFTIEFNCGDIYHNLWGKRFAMPVGDTRARTLVIPYSKLERPTWKDFSTYPKTFPTGDIVEISLYVGGPLGSGTFYVDDIKVETRSFPDTNTGLWEDVNGTLVPVAGAVATAVALNPATGSVDVGATSQIAPVFTPANASASLTWTSSNPAVATVSSSGLVQGVAVGTTTIRASAGSFFGEATITVAAPTPPAAPTTLAAAVFSASQINLSWVDNATNETGYKVERALAAAGPWTEIAASVAAGATSYSATGLVGSTAYWFRVRAANATGNSAYSNVVTATTPAGPSTAIDIVSTTTPPTIDGTVDTAWSSASAAQPITFATGSVADVADLSGGWRALWDSANLYIVVDVTDDTKTNDSPNPWDDDSVEVYIDGGNNKTATYDANDRQYVFGYGDTAVVEGGGRNAAGITFAKTDPTATTYRLEIKIPWSAVGSTPANGSSIGIDVQLNDDDNGGAREGKRAWKDGTDMSWGNPSLFGTGNLTSGSGPVVVPVSGVSVSPASASLLVGGSTNLSATVAPANATNTAVSWTTSNAAVATVSPTGVVNGVSAGTATITVTTADGGKTASSVITVGVPAVPVTSVSVTPVSATISVGGAVALSPAVVPGNATNTSVSWTTSDAAVATVSPIGVVLGVSAGTATITVTTADGGKTASSVITVSAPVVPVTGVSATPLTSTLSVGGAVSLTAVVAPANATNKMVGWTSSNAAVATVSPSGVVTGVSAGTATITVTTSDGSKTASSVITVSVPNVPVTGVSLTPAAVSVNVAASTTLAVTVAPANASNTAVSWTTSNAAIATVSPTGVVMGVSPGMATITVTTADGSKTATSAITVTAVNVPVTGVSVTPVSASVNVNATVALAATVAPANASNSAVSWITSNAAIATVSPTGVVTGVSAGTATITVTTADGAKTATGVITVTAINVPVTSVSVTPATLSLNVGGSATLTATILPANATNKSAAWTTSNAAVATVSPTGVVYGLAVGTATITATTADGAKTASSVVTVVQPMVNTQRYEGENGKGSADSFVFIDESASGGEARGGIDALGAYVEWYNVPPSSGFTVATFAPLATSLAVLVDGVKKATLTIPAAADWNEIPLVLAIPAGATLRVQREVADGTIADIDYIDLATTGAHATTALKASSAISVNGALAESIWVLNNSVLRTVSGSNNNTVTFGTLWDANYLYVGVKVLDATIRTNRPNVVDNDSVEIHLDGNFNKGTTYDAADLRINKQANARTVWTSRPVPGLQHARTPITGGYTVEIGIPWSALGGLPAAGAKVGLDVQVNDNDFGRGATGQLIWNGDAANPTSTVNFGEVIISPDVAGVLLVP